MLVRPYRLRHRNEVQTEAAATDVADSKPGLLARRRIEGEATRSRDNLGGDIAKGAASTVLSAATGGAGLPGQLVNAAGQGVI